MSDRTTKPPSTTPEVTPAEVEADALFDDPSQVMRRGLAVIGDGMRRQKLLSAISVAASVLFGAMTVADAWVLGWATDHLIRPSFDEGRVLTGALWTSVGLFLAVAVLRAVGIVGRRLIGGMVYFRLVAEDRRAVTRRYLALPLSWHHRHPTGQLLSNANADVEAAWFVFMPLPMAIGVVAMLVSAVVAMLAADVVLTVVGLVVFPALFAINYVYQRALSPRIARAQSLRGDLSAVAHESFDGALVVKSLGREATETERFRLKAEQLRDANIAAGRVRSVFDPVLEMLPNLGVVVVIWLGVLRVASNAADPGDVVQVAFLFTVVAFPVRAIGWLLGELPRSVVGHGRVDHVLRASGEMDYGDVRIVDGGAAALRLNGVSFGHGAASSVLRDLDLEVPAGRVVAIVGATGSGKSTITTLLSRLIDPDQGVIEIDGIDLRDATHESLAAAVAVVPQTTFMFDDSVRENVTLGADVEDDRLWAVLRTVQADEFVTALPAGLDTQLGERGTTLSGGQRQRLALARALVRDPRVLVLDDATSALDPDVERRILSALAERTAAGSGPTVVVVAYRKATIALADEVVFLAQGRIVDRGTHERLSRDNADYRRLVDAYDQTRAVTA